MSDTLYVQYRKNLDELDRAHAEQLGVDVNTFALSSGSPLTEEQFSKLSTEHQNLIGGQTYVRVVIEESERAANAIFEGKTPLP